MPLQDVFPPTVLLGRCAGSCGGKLVFSAEPHEWADPDTNEMRWPADRGARLYCGDCSNERWHPHERWPTPPTRRPLTRADLLVRQG